MRVLFDQGTPVPLRHLLGSHEVDTAFERGWSELRNGELLDAAEAAGFDVFVTTDQNLKFQQTLSQRSLAVVVLTTTSWPAIRSHPERALEAVESAEAGAYVEVTYEHP